MLKKALTAGLFCFSCFVQLAGANQLTIKVSNPDGSVVDTLIVYATPIGFAAPKRSPKVVEVTQKEWAFTPFMSVAQRTDNISFTNQDNFTHHIYSLTGASRFSFKLKPGEETTFDANKVKAEEEIAMGCNIHDWMSGFMLVVDTPYFEKTNQQGQVILDLEQAGRYKITVWHPQLQTKDHKINQMVDISGDQHLNLTLPKQLVVELPHVSQDEFDFLDQY